MNVDGNGFGDAAGVPGGSTAARDRFEPGSVSGRRFVVAAIIGLLAVWGVVYLAFDAWRARYQALAEFGATAVAPLVDPLADQVPPGVDPKAWRQAVADTHAMLVALAGAGLLDRTQLEDLRADVSTRVARASAGTARKELTDLWTDLERKAGPVISPIVTPARPGSSRANRHPRPPRPELLKPVPAAQ